MVKRIILSSHKEWLDNRKNRIGGSDASAVLGLNPYKSNVDLWLEKKGEIETEDISDKSYVKYGTNAEYYLRELFKLDFPQYKVEYYENNMIINDKYPFAHASLDGELTDEEGRKGILEIKTTNILQSMQKEKWKDKIPDNYYIQILHYLMVTEYDFVVLKAQLKSEFNQDVYLQTKHYFIEREEVLEDIEYLIKEEIKFYNLLEKGIRPNLILPEI
jgi:hypothetical protein